MVLARLTGSDDLLIAVPMAARTRPETESVVGLFMNTVPIRVRLDRDATLSALVRAVHAATGRVSGTRTCRSPGSWSWSGPTATRPGCRWSR